MKKWFKRLLCKHVVYIEELRRVDDNLVVANCAKCGKPFAAPYGLALAYRRVTLDQKPKAAVPQSATEPK